MLLLGDLIWFQAVMSEDLFVTNTEKGLGVHDLRLDFFMKYFHLSIFGKATFCFQSMIG